MESDGSEKYVLRLAIERSIGPTSLNTAFNVHRVSIRCFSPSCSGDRDEDMLPPLHAAVSSAKPTSKEFLPWVEKYRPESLNDLISQNDIVGTSKFARLVIAFITSSQPIAICSH